MPLPAQLDDLGPFVESIRDEAVKRIGRALARTAVTLDASVGGPVRSSGDIRRLAALAGDTRALIAQIDGLPRESKYLGDTTRLREFAGVVLSAVDANAPEVLAEHAISQVYAPFAQAYALVQLLNLQYERWFPGAPRPEDDESLLADFVDELRPLVDAMRLAAASLEKVSIEPAVVALQSALASNPLWHSIASGVAPDRAAAALRTRIANDLDIGGACIEAYKNHRDETLAERPHLAADRRGPVLVARAHAQLTHIATHFSSKQRPLATQRPALVQRIAEALKAVRAEMADARRTPLANAPSDAEYETVGNAVGRLNALANEIRKSRVQMKRPVLIRALGQAADMVLAEYDREFAGQDRRTRDLARLAQLCDRLAELGRQMLEIDRRDHDADNLRHLAVVTNHRLTFEREYRVIATIQAQSAAQSQSAR